MKAALGVRFLPDDFFLAAFLAVFFAAFLALLLADFFAVFFLAALACLPVNVRTVCASGPANYRDQQYTTGANLQ